MAKELQIVNLAILSVLIMGVTISFSLPMFFIDFTVGIWLIIYGFVLSGTLTAVKLHLRKRILNEKSDR